MFVRVSLVRTCGLAAVVSLVALVGCSKEEAAKPAETTPAAAAAQKIAESAVAEVQAKLAQADRLDGKEDKVVSRCGACALGMGGKAEFARKASDYTLHFCTEGCAKGFGENMTESILAMKIPDE